MDGFSAARALRQREASGRRLPVIALTADATPQGRAACLGAGMDDYLAKPFTREALRSVLMRWLPAVAGRGAADNDAPRDGAARDGTDHDPAAELLLDRATLEALRALPPRGPKDMLSHIGALLSCGLQRLFAAIESAVEAGQARELARAAHAWRSYNGHVGALGLMHLCRELEACGRAADLSAAPALFAQIRLLHPRVTQELQCEMRKTA